MIRNLLNSARRIVYIRIASDRIIMQSNDGLHWEASPDVGIKSKGKDEVIAVIKDGGASYQDAGGVTRWVNPFSHPRTIFSDFTVGEKLVRHGLLTMFGSRFTGVSPALGIIHPLEKLEGGLTEIEQRALKELGLAAGFREVRVYTGLELVVRGMTMKNVDGRLGGADGRAMAS